MAEEQERDERLDDRTYEPPEVEEIGPAEELARGNEGSKTDGAPA